MGLLPDIAFSFEFPALLFSGLLSRTLGDSSLAKAESGNQKDIRGPLERTRSTWIGEHFHAGSQTNFQLSTLNKQKCLTGCPLLDKEVDVPGE